MNVLNLCSNDWANFAYDNKEALREVGINCIGLKREPHPNKYFEELKTSTIEEMKEAISKADVIQFFHDDLRLFEALIPALKSKRVIAWHTSSLYRRDYQRINYVMNPLIFGTVNAMPEFMGRGSKNETYIVGAYDTDLTKPKNYELRRPYTIAHYPSSAEVKGTAAIVEIMERLKGAKAIKDNQSRFNYSTELLPHELQKARMSGCDIYIELFSFRDALGSAYGNFGITALEAAAMGKVVVTCNVGLPVYEKYYGPSELQIVNSILEFEKKIIELNYFSAFELLSLQKKTREWVVRNHSYEATGRRIKSFISQ